MSISAIKCTPIKPQVSFRADDAQQKEIDHEKLHGLAEELASSENSTKIKKPLAVIASFAALAGLAYGGGKKVATGVNAIYEKAVAAAKPVVKEAADDVANAAKEGADDAAKAIKNSNLGVVLEDGLKKASSLATKGIDKLRVSTADDIAELTKSQKVRNKAADVLQKGLDLAKTGYKKIAYSGIADDVVGADRAKQAFENVAGAAGLVYGTAQVLSDDGDKTTGEKPNKIADILEKGPSAYGVVGEAINDATKDLGIIGQIVETLS